MRRLFLFFTELRKFCLQSTRFTLIPFDLTLMAFEVAGAILQKLIQLDPAREQNLQSLRRDESQVLETMEQNKVILSFRIPREVSLFVLFRNGIAKSMY